MSEIATVTVLVSTELLAELGDWSQPVQVKVVETPSIGTGYELIARTLDEVEVGPGADGGWLTLELGIDPPFYRVASR